MRRTALTLVNLFHHWTSSRNSAASLAFNSGVFSALHGVPSPSTFMAVLSPPELPIPQRKLIIFFQAGTSRGSFANPAVAAFLGSFLKSSSYSSSNLSNLSLTSVEWRDQKVRR